MKVGSLLKVAACSLVFGGFAGCEDNDALDAPGTEGSIAVELKTSEAAASAVIQSVFGVTSLVTDQTDPDLVNPWGLVGAEGVFWIADNATGKVSTYDGNGKPSAEYPRGRFDLGEGITGVARLEDDEKEGGAESDEFLVPCDAHADRSPAEFVFANEDGTLIAINDDAPTGGFKVVDRSAVGAVYLGVAKVDMADGPVLLAADFVNGRVDMFDDNFKLMPATKAFVDPEMPAGFGPFNVMAFEDAVYVMYAKIGEGGDEEAGPGLGRVTIFDVKGNPTFRLKTDLFNAPWGVAIAEPGSKMSASKTSDTLFIGNFGDGRITRFDLGTLAPIDQLSDREGNPIALEGLWGITMGGEDAGDDALYFAQGPEDETGGVFGRIDRL